MKVQAIRRLSRLPVNLSAFLIALFLAFVLASSMPGRLPAQTMLGDFTGQVTDATGRCP